MLILHTAVHVDLAAEYRALYKVAPDLGGSPRSGVRAEPASGVTAARATAEAKAKAKVETEKAKLAGKDSWRYDPREFASSAAPQRDARRANAHAMDCD